MVDGESGQPGPAVTSHVEMDVSGEAENVTTLLHLTVDAPVEKDTTQKLRTAQEHHVQVSLHSSPKLLLAV